MAVEKIDMQIQSMLSDAQMRTQKDVGKDDAADAPAKPVPIIITGDLV